VPEVVFTVPSNPVPKPRMTQSDKWAMKKKGPRADLLARYYKWKDAVAWAYKTTKNKPPIFTKCAMGFKFYLVGHPASDLDNFIKGAKDSLTGLAYSDDNGKVVRGYYDDPWIFYVCDSCPDRKPGKADCGKIGLCNKGSAVIKIKSVD
jgi:Holliday junction resolvase RusA-like endonuclease